MVEYPSYVGDLINNSKLEPLRMEKYTDTIYFKYSDKDAISIPISDIFINNRVQLEPYIQTHAIPDEYLYQPKTVSYYLYGTTELWLPLLRVNGMRNVSEFNKNIILVYDPSRIREIASIIIKRNK